MKKSKYVLDSYALLADFQAESGGSKVRDILKEASAGRSSALLSVINLGEIYCIVARKRDKETAFHIMMICPSFEDNFADPGLCRP